MNKISRVEGHIFSKKQTLIKTNAIELTNHKYKRRRVLPVIFTAGTIWKGVCSAMKGVLYKLYKRRRVCLLFHFGRGLFRYGRGFIPHMQN